MPASPTMNPLSLASLEQTAQRASLNAYAPYSRFPVGAAVLATDGTQHTGCNVENASFKAVAAGYQTFQCIAIHTPTPAPTAPCGACRQVLREFGPDMTIISTCNGQGRIETTLDQLLPNSFGPEDLNSNASISGHRADSLGMLRHPLGIRGGRIFRLRSMAELWQSRP